jgi:hypothetical protein
MPRTFIQQDTQIINSTVYDDTLTMSAAETATNLEEDLNYVRTQLKTFLGKTDWFDAVTDNFNLTAIHDKRLLYWMQKTDDVTVPDSQNFVALTGATKPGHNIAIGSTALGAITAQLVGTIGSHSTTVAANNGNVMEIRDAATNQPILTSGGYTIYGLLQVGADATDGNPFGDTASDDQGQISFIYFNPDTEAITAVAIADIENKVIEYAYKIRTDFYSLPEGAYDQSITFIDSSALASIDLQDVYDHDTDGSFSLASGKDYTINLNSNANAEIVDGSTVYLTTDRANTLLKSGVDFGIAGGSDLRLYDTDNSNYVGFVAPALSANQIWTLPATDGTAGQVIYTDGSGVLGWKAASASYKATRVVATEIAANTAINISTFTNPDGLDFGTVAADWVNNYEVFVNGVLQLSGVDAAANNDVYWLSSATIAFEYKIKAGDVVQIIKRK